MSTLSPVRRREVLTALRQGTVPPAGNLDVLAVGIDRFAPTVDEEIETVAAGGSAFKAVRGEYGSGKTFFARWVQQRAMRRGMAVARYRSASSRPRFTSSKPSIAARPNRCTRQPFHPQPSGT